MISLDIVEESILELEKKDTSFAVCDKLADLYIVRDHLKQTTPVYVDAAGNSEFLQAVDGKSPEPVWKIMDDLVEAIKVLHPGLYDSLLDKIRNI